MYLAEKTFFKLFWEEQFSQHNPKLLHAGYFKKNDFQLKKIANFQSTFRYVIEWDKYLFKMLNIY